MVPGPLNAYGYAVVGSLAAAVGLLFVDGGAHAGYATVPAVLALLFLVRARRQYRRRESGGETTDDGDDEGRSRQEKEMYGKSYGWL